MWNPKSQYDVIIETLTGSEFEVAVCDKDTILNIKLKIQRIEGIPVGQQHILYNHKELSDNMKLEELSLSSGSRLKLVLNMKGGPVSARRILSLPDYDNWLDFSEVLNTSRNDPITLSTPGIKLLVYKDSKKNHRIMKLKHDRKGSATKTNTENYSNDMTKDQWVKDNLQTLDKMYQLRMKLDEKKKNNKSEKKSYFTFNQNTSDMNEEVFKYGFPDGLSKKKLIKANSFMNETHMKSLKMYNSQYPFVPIQNKLLQFEKIKNNDCSFQRNGKQTCALLNKYGLSKTCVRLPNLTQSPVKDENKTKLSTTTTTTTSTPTTRSMPHVYSAKYQKNTLSWPKYGSESEELRSKLRENISRNRSFKIKKCNEQFFHRYFFKPTVSNSASFNDIVTDTKLNRNFNFKSLENLDEKNAMGSNHSVIDLKNLLPNNIEYEGILTTRPDFLLNSVTLDKIHLIDNVQTFDKTIMNSEIQEDDSNETTSALDMKFFNMFLKDKKNCDLTKLVISENSSIEKCSNPKFKTLNLNCYLPENSPRETLAASEKKSFSNFQLLRQNKNSTTTLPWNNDFDHHHSDLELNNLELSGCKERISESSTDVNSENCLDSKLTSNLEINCIWNNGSMNSDEQLGPSSSSLNFTNSELMSSDDEEIINENSISHNSKTKANEINKFRIMFGSSPTLLSPSHNLSRLDDIPLQYRRGYANLNDACLSSSTSELGCFNSGTHKKMSSKSVSQELPFSYAYKKTNNDSLDFIRSYENLDESKILKLKNKSEMMKSRIVTDKRNNMKVRKSSPENAVSEDSFLVFDINKRNHNLVDNKTSRKSLDENYFSSNDHISYSTLSYISKYEAVEDYDEENEFNISPNFPSDENLFNMNLDQLTDDFNLLSTNYGDSQDIHENTNNDDTNVSNQTIKPNNNNSNNNKTNNNGKWLQQTMNVTKSQNQFVDNDQTSHIQVVNVEQKQKKQRCAKCSKKLSLIMAMECHCKEIFCPQHRYAETHNCSYDFKKEGKEIIKRENPLVIASKLSKI